MGKITNEDIEAGINHVPSNKGFADTLAAVNNTKKADEPVPAAEPTKRRKSNVLSFQANDETIAALEEYCRKNDMTLTAGIKRAIREMIERERNR